MNIPTVRTLSSPLPSKLDEILNFDPYLGAKNSTESGSLFKLLTTFPKIVDIMSPNLSVVMESKLPNHANPIQGSRDISEGEPLEAAGTDPRRASDP